MISNKTDSDIIFQKHDRIG